MTKLKTTSFTPPTISVGAPVGTSAQRVPRSMPTTPRGNPPILSVPLSHSSTLPHGTPSNDNDPQTPPPAYELLPTHIRHNFQQSKSIAFHVSPRRVLRNHSYNHALRSTRRLISSMHALRSGLELYAKRCMIIQQQELQHQNGSKINPVHPSLSSLSSSASSAAESHPLSTDSSDSSNTNNHDTNKHTNSTRHRKTTSSPNNSYAESNSIHKLPRRVDGLQATASKLVDGRRKRRSRSEAKSSSTFHIDELIRSVQLMDKSLMASRERAQRAMQSISAAHDTFVLLSVFLSLPTTPGLNATDGGRTITNNTEACSKNLKLSTSRSKRKQQQPSRAQPFSNNNNEAYNPQLPRRASAPSLGSRPDGRNVRVHHGNGHTNRRRPPSALHDLIDQGKEKEGWSGFGHGRKRKLVHSASREVHGAGQGRHLNQGRGNGAPWRRAIVV